MDRALEVISYCILGAASIAMTCLLGFTFLRTLFGSVSQAIERPEEPRYFEPRYTGVTQRKWIPRSKTYRGKKSR